MVDIYVSNDGVDVRYSDNVSYYNSFESLRKDYGHEDFSSWMWYMRKHNFILIDRR